MFTDGRSYRTASLSREARYSVRLVELVEGCRITVRLMADRQTWRAGQGVAMVEPDPARGPVFEPVDG